MIKRSATATWAGTASKGAGTLSTPSLVLSETAYTMSTRFHDEDGAAGTNPEELLAAAHAGCFAMSLGYALEVAGMQPSRIDVEATVTLRAIDGGFEISQIHLALDASVPGASAEEFHERAEAARALCPLSMALHAVPMTLDVTLQGE